MYLIWKTTEYFQPRSVLEIGSFAGQTLGLLYEASNSNSYIHSIDINLSRLVVFQNLFPDNNVTFSKIDSMLFEPAGRYDLIHVDGDHDYEHAYNDIHKSLSMVQDNSIIIVDDYEKSWLGVPNAIEDLLLGQHGFVPFMVGDASAFFHRETHDAEHFLDEWIQDRAQNFMHFHNIDFYGYTVLRPHFVSQSVLTSDMPGLFSRSLNLFTDAVNFYDL